MIPTEITEFAKNTNNWQLANQLLKPYLNMAYDRFLYMVTAYKKIAINEFTHYRFCIQQNRVITKMIMFKVGNKLVHKISFMELLANNNLYTKSSALYRKIQPYKLEMDIEVE